jgi:hypothetical protein
VAALVFLGLFLVLGVLALLGWTADTRDPDYSLGRLLLPDPRPGPARRGPVRSLTGRTGPPRGSGTQR